MQQRMPTISSPSAPSLLVALLSADARPSLPIGEKLYELDGLKPLPVSHGVIPGGRAAWTELAKTFVFLLSRLN